jgi:hypothetical protein
MPLQRILSEPQHSALHRAGQFSPADAQRYER